MSITIKKIALNLNGNIKTNLLLFIPHAMEQEQVKLAIFTHGYTSHKASILSWAMKFSMNGHPCVLFDLPGHYLGSFSELPSFDAFARDTPHIFQKAYELSLDHLNLQVKPQLLIGGHSLGALMAMKAASETAINPFKIFAVGFAYQIGDQHHLFQTDFFKQTLEFRKELVSDYISPNVIFPWIQSQKEELRLTGQSIYLISGQDDLVANEESTSRLAHDLMKKGNKVDRLIPSKLPHHQPELAAPHIWSIAKKL